MLVSRESCGAASMFRESAKPHNTVVLLQQVLPKASPRSVLSGFFSKDDSASNNGDEQWLSNE